MRNYFPTNHAVDQAVERFGVPKQRARNWMNTLMQTAYYQGTDGTGRIFDNQNQRVRMILDLKKDAIITVYSMDSEKPAKIYDAPFTDIVAATIKRELAKARRIFIAEFRKLKIEQAELGVEIAQAHVNKARCKAPHTQALIQKRIDATQEYYNVVQAKIDGLQAEYSRTKTEAQAFLGNEVTS